MLAKWRIIGCRAGLRCCRAVAVEELSSELWPWRRYQARLWPCRALDWAFEARRQSGVGASELARLWPWQALNLAFEARRQSGVGASAQAIGRSRRQKVKSCLTVTTSDSKREGGGGAYLVRGIVRCIIREDPDYFLASAGVSLTGQRASLTGPGIISRTSPLGWIIPNRAPLVFSYRLVAPAPPHLLFYQLSCFTNRFVAPRAHRSSSEQAAERGLLLQPRRSFAFEREGPPS